MRVGLTLSAVSDISGTRLKCFNAAETYRLEPDRINVNAGIVCQPNWAFRPFAKIIQHIGSRFARLNLEASSCILQTVIAPNKIGAVHPWKVFAVYN